MDKQDEAIYADLVGDDWRSTYRDRFLELEGGGGRLGWNAEAAFTPLWGYRRRIPLLRGLVLLFPVIGIGAAYTENILLALALPTALFVLGHGLLGDWAYFAELRRVVARAKAEPDEAKRARILRSARVGGTIAHVLACLLLVPLTYLVIFAAVPQGYHDHGKGDIVSQKAGLRNLQTWQEAMLADSGRYSMAIDSDALADSRVVLEMEYADSTGYGARSRIEGSPTRCLIFVGPRRGQPADAVEFEPYCETSDAERH